jgi:hypothetical protein
MMLLSATARQAGTPLETLRSERLSPWHRDRLAVV